MVIGIGLLCYYTSRLIIVHGKNYDDFSAMCTAHVSLGTLMSTRSRLSWRLGSDPCYGVVPCSVRPRCARSVMTCCRLLGAVIAYHSLMSGFLWQLVNAARGSTAPSGVWVQQAPAIVILIAVFPLSLLRNLKALVKFSSLGILFVFFTVTFVIVKSFIGFDISGAAYPMFETGCPDEGPCLPLFDPNWGKFASVLPVSFFVHNVGPCVLSGC